MIEGIALEDAIALMIKHVKIIEDVEEVNILKAFDRILADAIYAPHDQPPFNRSAVDGYAIQYEDCEGATPNTPCKLQVIECVYAGGYPQKEIAKGQAAQIMTGACIPKGATCVVRLEDSNDDIHDLQIYHGANKNENVCYQGEDYQKASCLLKSQDRLDAARLALASSAGIHTYHVLRKVKVALIISGDEIIPLQTPLHDGKIYDSNFAYLYHRLTQMGYEVSAYAYVEDDAKACAQKLIQFTKDADFIITTGGVSVGKKDILHEALDIAKAVKLYWRVHIKPGTPAMFSMLHGVGILSLSGNPFAASATFEVLATAVLSHIQQNKQQLQKKEGILMSWYPKPSAQRRLLRAIYKDGLVSIPSGMLVSGTIRSFIGCNCFIDIPAGTTALHIKDKVNVWMLGGYYE